MISATEYLVHIKTTAAFIEADAIDLVIMRRTREQLDTGGYQFSDPTPLSPQRVRLIPQSDAQKELQDDHGRIAHPDYVLLGMPNMDVERFDRFVYDGFEYLVLSEPHGPSYEVKVDVMRVGG